MHIPFSILYNYNTNKLLGFFNNLIILLCGFDCITYIFLSRKLCIYPKINIFIIHLNTGREHKISNPRVKIQLGQWHEEIYTSSCIHLGIINEDK